ncbi:MAG: DUF1553 domain-containing protein [Acidobacteria bacterium]|nr:DUF1553 domain-containing protein [Acidobacteriota bacterium]
MKPFLHIALLLGCGTLAAQAPKAKLSVPRISFVNDIVPILTKAGCANSNCHGSVRGQAGFKLSLFGYEPELDYAAIVKDADGRRIDRQRPETSLVLTKPTYEIQHGGGERFKNNSLEFAAIRDWIRQGALFDSPNSPRIRDLTVSPAEITLAGESATGKLTAKAAFSNGAVTDVSAKVQYTPSDETIVEIGPAGELKALRTGETTVMVRTLGKAVAARVYVIRRAAGAGYRAPAHNNFIDDHVFAKLKRLNILPSQLSSDTQFLRRVYLDVTGSLPTEEESLEFLSSQEESKRSRLIDRLLESPEYSEVWATRLSDVFRVGGGVGPKAARNMYHHLRTAIATDRPYSELVSQMLTSSGGVSRNAPSNFYRTNFDLKPEDAPITVSQTLLGIRLDCARCHNHPFEKWTQNDFWGFAAFFGRTEFKFTPLDAALILKDRSEIINPGTKKLAIPKYLDGPEVTEGPDEDIRERLAAWITSPKNPWFSRAIVNRVWKHYMGRGLVEPVDDFRVTNPPTNPALLDALADDFAKSNFSLRQLSRRILNSRTYQLSSEFNDSNRGDQINYASYYVKRLMAEQLMDALSQVAGEQEVYRGMKSGARSFEIPAGSPNYFLTTFGRPMFRDVICERDEQPAMAQALHLIAGDTLNKKIVSQKGALARMLDDPYLRDEDVVRRMFFSALVRPPEKTEVELALAPIKEKGKVARRKAFEDLLWALLNSKEFLYNH